MPSNELIAEGQLLASNYDEYFVSNTDTADLISRLTTALEAAEQERQEWRDIESCPIEVEVLFLIEGIPYKGRIVMNQGVKNYHWWMHTDISTGLTYTKTKDDNGREVRTILNEGEETNFQPRCLGWKRGMNSTPTHWLPNPPIENYNDEV